MKRLIVFDLDGTLAESKSPLDTEMANLLHKLLDFLKVAVISGGDWPQFEKQVLFNLPKDYRLENLFLLPTCGTKFYKLYVGEWKKIYSEDFTEDEKKKVTDSLTKAIQKTGDKQKKIWGERIDDRGGQITHSAIGQQAPLAEKVKWDPDFSKRKKIKAILNTSIPGFSVNLSGTTSLNITKAGIDKSYGISKLKDTLGIALQDMVFIGDALFPGGNDYSVKEAGVVSVQVRDHNETKRVIEGMIACLDSMNEPTV